MDAVRALKIKIENEIETCNWHLANLSYYIDKAKTDKPNLERQLILIEGLLELESTISKVNRENNREETKK